MSGSTAPHLAPSSGRGAKLKSGLPVLSVITAPIGYDSEMEAKRLLMWLSSQTQPRWKSGNCNAPRSALRRRSASGISSLLNVLSMKSFAQWVHGRDPNRRCGATTLAPSATGRPREWSDLGPAAADRAVSAVGPHPTLTPRKPVTESYPTHVPFGNYQVLRSSDARWMFTTFRTEPVGHRASKRETPRSGEIRRSCAAPPVSNLPSAVGDPSVRWARVATASCAPPHRHAD